MRDLMELYQKVIMDAKQLNIPYGNIVEVKTSTELKHSYGNCLYIDLEDYYIITINEELLDDNVPEQSIKDTLLHEVIHTCPKCMNHQKYWKKYVKIANESGLGYTITPTSSREEKGLNPIPENTKENEKYIFKNCKCKKCGRNVIELFKPNLNKDLEDYYCRFCKEDTVLVGMSNML